MMAYNNIQNNCYAEIFQVIVVVVPFCLHKVVHRLDFQNRHFQQVMIEGVTAVLVQYIWELDTLECQE